MDNSKIPEERVRELFEEMIDWIIETAHPMTEGIDVLVRVCGFTRDELLYEHFDPDDVDGYFKDNKEEEE